MPRLALTILNRSGKRPRYGRARLQRVLDAATKEAGIHRASLTILLVGDDESASLHGQHFNDPTTTDVMTFPDGAEDPATGIPHLGDLAVCVDVAAREGAARERTTGDELTLYCLHGLLHLIGYDDVTAKKQTRMWQAQRRLLGKVGITIEARPT
ncbi:MAG: rRNA maturation RNase YbeY [Planctomycetes bacterium]|jgi:probable rRNA maturation factor|nr:rRNA maturation RNase YbeY [Planctomycetota bacterium]